jgi:hypothetical protein
MDWHFYDKTSLTTANTEEYASSVATSAPGHKRSFGSTIKKVRT